jgi:hypothetical protein
VVILVVVGGGVYAGIVCIVHGLSRSGKGGQQGCCHQGMRELGEWGGGCGCRVLGVFIRYRQKE